MAGERNDDTAGEQFCEFLTRASIPLRELDAEQLPKRTASGCLLDYGKRRWILTVAHATSNMGNWAIELSYDRQRGMDLYRIGPMTFLKSGRLNEPKVRTLDVAYAEIPATITPRWQLVNERGQVTADTARLVFHSDQFRTAHQSGTYGFAGYVLATRERHFGVHYLSARSSCWMGLRFHSEDDDFFYFSSSSAYQRPNRSKAPVARQSATAKAIP
jgi:hypothetical protein